MPNYRIRVVGVDFDAEDPDDGDSKAYPDLEAATKAAVGAAIEMAADDCGRGQCGCVLEARIEEGDEVVARYAIALSVEPLPPPH